MELILYFYTIYTYIKLYAYLSLKGGIKQRIKKKRKKNIYNEGGEETNQN